MQQHEIDRIIAALLQHKPDATDGALCRATGFTEQQIALARYRASKPARRAQAPVGALGQRKSYGIDKRSQQQKIDDIAAYVRLLRG